MTLRQVEFFVSVYENRSFSKAAKKLFVSQQTISKSIRELEMELGRELFERTSTGVMPNNYGEYVYEELKHIQNRVSALPTRLTQLGTEARERLNLVVAFGVIGALAQDVFDRFCAMHPEIDLHLSDAQDLVVEERVMSGEADLGIGVGPIDAARFESQLLKRERMYLCIHREHPLYGEENITMDSLRGHKFLNMSPLFKGYYNLANACKHAGFDVYVPFTSNEMITLKEMAQKNLGLLTVPTSKAYSSSPDVRFVPFPDDYYNYSLYLINRLGQGGSPGQRALKGYLIDIYRAQGDVLQ